VVVITANYVSTKRRPLLLKRKHSSYDAWFFKLKLANFVATSNQWKSWCTARIMCFNESFKRNCL